MATWEDWGALVDEARAAWENGESFDAVSRKLDRANVMSDKIMKEQDEETKKKKEGEVTFEETGAQIGRLVTEKNKAYGDSFVKSGEVLKILYPDGIDLEDYKNVLTIVRIIDKLFRICTNKDRDGENPFYDIAGYCILKVTEAKNEK